MTSLRHLSGEDLGGRLNAAVADSVVEWSDDAVWVRPERIGDVAAFLYGDESLDFQFLNTISAVDYIGYFELVYHLTSFRKMHAATVKSKLHGREELWAPSVYHLWRGADFQEREIWDLMGINFDGHPNMKRIMLWEGFDGHPLRKDYL